MRRVKSETLKKKDQKVVKKHLTIKTVSEKAGENGISC